METNFVKQKVLIIKTDYVIANLHVLGVGANAVDHLVGLDLPGADFVDGGEERELVLHALGLEHVIDLFSGNWSLKAIQCQMDSEE